MPIISPRLRKKLNNAQADLNADVFGQLPGEGEERDGGGLRGWCVVRDAPHDFGQIFVKRFSAGVWEERGIHNRHRPTKTTACWSCRSICFAMARDVVENCFQTTPTATFLVVPSGITQTPNSCCSRGHHMCVCMCVRCVCCVCALCALCVLRVLYVLHCVCVMCV
jgi:hypothetical protein